MPYLVAGAFIRRRGQGDARDGREALLQLIQRQVVLAEIMPPLGDAMGLVNGKQGKLCPLPQCQGAFLQQPFRGDIEQVHVVVQQTLFRFPYGLRGQG